jgi:hypothetical protein
MPSLMASISLDAAQFNAAAARVTERTRAMGAQMSKVGFGRSAQEAAMSAEKFSAMRGELARAGMSPAAASAALRAQELADKTDKATRSTSALGSAVKMFAAYASFDFLRNQAMQVMEWGGKISDLSARLGISAGAVQTWSYVLKQNGGDVEDMVKFFERLAVARRDALEGGDKKMAAFSKLGVSKEMLETGSLEQIGAQIGKVFEGGADPQNFLAELRDVGGRSAGDMVAMFSQGFDQLAAEAQGLGVVMSDSTVQALDALGDRLDLLKTQFQTTIAPIFVGIAEVAMNVVQSVTAMGASISSFFGTIVDAAVNNPKELLNPIALNWKAWNAAADTGVSKYEKDQKTIANIDEKAANKQKKFQLATGEGSKTAKKLEAESKKEVKEQAKDDLMALDERMDTLKGAGKGHSVNSLQQMGGFLGNFAAAGAPEVALMNSQLNELKDIKKILQKQSRTGVEAADTEY